MFLTFMCFTLFSSEIANMVDWENFEEGWEKNEEMVVSALKESSLWNDAKRKEKLLKYLAQAGKIRSKVLVPILLPHITYAPLEKKDEVRLSSFEEQYPVAYALGKTGCCAVPFLLKKIKNLDPENKAPSNQNEIRLLVICLLEIYSEGDGKNGMAKQRIEKEIMESSSKKEKEALRSAMKYLD